MAGPSPHNTKSTCPTEKAWRHTIRHGAPLQLNVLLVFYNDFWFSPSRKHAVCIVFYPCVLFLQRVLTRKTSDDLSSLGVLLVIVILLVLSVDLLLFCLYLITRQKTIAEHFCGTPTMQHMQNSTKSTHDAPTMQNMTNSMPDASRTATKTTNSMPDASQVQQNYTFDA
jgi:hypothetical protein